MIQLQLNCPICDKDIGLLLPDNVVFNIFCPNCTTEFGKSIPSSGFIYALKNDSMPDLLKIGFTTRSVEERVAELDSSTATPTPFELVFYFASNEPQSDEAMIHKVLMHYRINQSREFFQITESEALLILREKLARQEVFLNKKICIDNRQMVVKSPNLDEDLKNEVTQLRQSWSSTGDASKGISLIYRLLSERRYLAAKEIVNLFLTDNPGHGVALSLREEVCAKLIENRPNE